MKKRMFLLASSLMVIFSIALVGCSRYVKEDTGTLVANDEIMQGPGIFTGKKGAFYLVGGSKTTPVQAIHTRNNNEVMQEIDHKLKQLDKDKADLEKMKSQLKNRLNN